MRGGLGAVASELGVGGSGSCKNWRAAPQPRGTPGAEREGRGTHGFPSRHLVANVFCIRQCAEQVGPRPGGAHVSICHHRLPEAPGWRWDASHSVSRPRTLDRGSPPRFSGLTVPAGEGGRGCPCAVLEGAARRLICEACVDVVWGRLAPS